MNRELLVVRGPEVEELLRGRESEVIAAVRVAYETLGRGDASNPFSSFLRFPDSPRDRIIALPAYLGGEGETAGIKWVASVPGNVERGTPRASAVLVLNARETGYPHAFLEASLISAARTAASAALAASVLASEAPAAIGLVGCGPIQRMLVRYLRAVWPEVSDFVLYDLAPERAAELGRRLEEEHAGVQARASASMEELLEGVSTLSLATTASHPHLEDLSALGPKGLVLNVSLRDIAAAVILASRNVVDDAEHVSREGTSIHLAEQAAGNRDFIAASLPEVLLGKQLPSAEGRLTIFSPFGLGVLDLAVGRWVHGRARREGLGVRVPDFLPAEEG